MEFRNCIGIYGRNREHVIRFHRVTFTYEFDKNQLQIETLSLGLYTLSLLDCYYHNKSGWLYLYVDVIALIGRFYQGKLPSCPAIDVMNHYTPFDNRKRESEEKRHARWQVVHLPIKNNYILVKAHGKT